MARDRGVRPRETGAYPPLSQIPHGTPARSFAAAVREPSVFSHAQKKSVLLGWPGRSTGMFPAKLRDSDQETPGKGSVTWKSTSHRSQ